MGARHLRPTRCPEVLEMRSQHLGIAEDIIGQRPPGVDDGETVGLQLPREAGVPPRLERSPGCRNHRAATHRDSALSHEPRRKIRKVLRIQDPVERRHRGLMDVAPADDRALVDGGRFSAQLHHVERAIALRFENPREPFSVAGRHREQSVAFHDDLVRRQNRADEGIRIVAVSDRAEVRANGAAFVASAVTRHTPRSIEESRTALRVGGRKT